MSEQEKLPFAKLAAEKDTGLIKNESKGNGQIVLSIISIMLGVGVYYWFLQKNIYISLASIILGSAIAIFCFLTSPQGKNLLTFVKEAKAELRRVTWPDRSEVQKMTLFVLVVVFIVMLLIAAFDSLLTVLIQFLITLR